MPTNHPEAIAHYPQSMQIFVKALVHRIDSGKNAMVGVFGPTGSGKSLATLQIMKAVNLYKYGKELTDDEVINHTFFKAKPFMEAMNKISKVLTEESQRLRSESWLWDEAGVEAGHKDFMSVRNKILGWLVQTFRNLRQIVFFTTPSLSFIDASIRKLIHYYVECVTIDKKQRICVLKPLQMQYNIRFDKIYYHNLRVPTADEGITEVEFMGVPKISDELEKMYEVKKNEFTGDLNQEILDKLEQIEMNKGLKPLTERQEQILELLEKGVTATKDIAEEVGCDAATISRNFGFMERKGVKIKELRKERPELKV